MNLDELYSALKSKVTGQVIGGTLTGVILESELEELYEQIRREQRIIDQIEQGSGG
jgi:hypothetical protein